MRQLVFVTALLAALLAALVPLAAPAEPLRGIEVTPVVGYRVGGEFKRPEGVTGPAIKLDEGSAWGLIVNWPSVANTEWEVYLSRQATGLKPTGTLVPGIDLPADLDVSYLQVGGTYWFDGERARPYIVATLGASRFEPSGSDFSSETFFAFGIGGGYKLAPTSRIGVRLEGRVFGSVIDSNESIFCGASAAGSGCLIAVSGSLLWQWEFSAGLTFRW